MDFSKEFKELADAYEKTIKECKEEIDSRLLHVLVPEMRSFLRAFDDMMESKAKLMTLSMKLSHLNACAGDNEDDE